MLIYFNYGNHFEYYELNFTFDVLQICFFKEHHLKTRNLVSEFLIAILPCVQNYFDSSFLFDLTKFSIFSRGITKVNFKLKYHLKKQNCFIALCSNNLVGYKGVKSVLMNNPYSCYQSFYTKVI